MLDEEVETSPSPDEAVLPRVLSLLSSSKEYLDVVLQLTRKTEVRQWSTLFAYLPPAQELFEESLQRGSLKTAGGYLIILHTLEELGGAASTEQTVRVLSRAMREGQWELCRELARFLAAMDDTGETLEKTMAEAKQALTQEDPVPVKGMANLLVPSGSRNGNSSDDEGQSLSESGSVSSLASP